MSSNLSHSSWVTGFRQKTTTGPGSLTPPVNAEWYPGGGLGNALDAPFSSCTITAEAIVTYGAVTYGAGDILFSSDGREIFDSTGSVMSGSLNTGGYRGIPQGVMIVKVIDDLSDSIGKKGELFWVFTNALHYGLRVGLIDMTGNGGLGVYSNYSLSGLTPSGGQLGTVLGSEKGMGGRMTGCCKRDNDDLELIIGQIVIYKEQVNAGGTNWEDFGWVANELSQIAANGFPDITAASAQPVNSPVGITATGTNNAPIHGVVAITPQNNNILDPMQDHYKLATIWREAVGSAGVPLSSAFVEVLTFNQDSLAVLNPGTKLTYMIDKGPTVWPIPSGGHSRFYGMGLEFSHDSTDTLAYLYYPNFDDSVVPGGTLEIKWNEIDSGNQFHLTNKGTIPILDAGGNKIWGGPSNPGRILAGIWRDPSKTGRLFVSTPEVVGVHTGAVSASGPTWCVEYPEIYGTLSSSPNLIQHCILENCDDPLSTAPSQIMQGTISDQSYYQYGSPSFTVCSYGVDGAQVYIGKCPPTFSWAVDSTNNLWKVDITGAGAVVNQVTNISTLTNFISITHDKYRDMLYIWDSPAGGNSLSYRKYDTDINAITNPQQIVAPATYDQINAVDSSSYLPTATVGALNPITDGECKEHAFIGLKAGTVDKFALGVIDVSTNTASAYDVTYEIDTTVDFGGVLSGKIPVHMATARNVDQPTTFISYVAFEDRIAYCDGPTGAWTLLATTGPAGGYTSLHFKNLTATTNPVLYATAGAAGSNKIYTINIITGAATLIGVGDITTDPGGFLWPDLMAGATYQNGFRYFEIAPLVVDSLLHPTDYPIYSNLCKNLYDVWQQPHPLSEHVGCFQCAADGPNFHLLDTSCHWYTPATFFTNCRECEDRLTEECMAFLPCCNIDVGASTYGLGPMELPGIATNNAASFTVGNVYDISIGGSTPICATAIQPDPQFWISRGDGWIFQIDGPYSTGICTVPGWATTHGPLVGLMDIAFDKNGNVIYTQSANDISWASVWPGYESPPLLITSTFSVPLALDTDYTASNHIVGADMVAGVASFRTYTNSVGAGIALVTTITNATISVGHDLSVDYNSGDYFTLGDVTGAGGLDDLLSIDNTTGAHTLVSNLATVCSFTVDQHAYGIERKRDTGATSLTYILSAKYISINNYEYYFHELDDAGLTQISVIPLLNPASSTNNWTEVPTGLAYGDICSKWPGNVDPAVSPWADCTACLNAQTTEDCCYKLTDCVTGSVMHSNNSFLDPYVGMVIRLIDDSCHEVERIPICVAPVSVVPHGTPGPFVDCPACAVSPTICYKLPSCCDPADIVYTDDALTPSITGIYNGGYVVQLTGECFCREVIINPCTSSEVAVSVSNTLPACNNYCKWNINMMNCVTGAIVSVDWCTSPNIVAAVGGAEAYEITVGGSVPDPINLCWEKIDPCQGPTNTTYPAGVITAVHADCTICANAGQTCVVVTHCCGTSYVLPQVVDVATGITAADIGFVVQADIIVAGTLYTGCWEVTANTPPGDCTSVLPNADVNAINTATVGSGNMLDCTYCPVTPCPPACTLLESCVTPGSFITVDGATGASIGSDVVTLGGYPDCWKVCSSQGNPIAGSQWFYGERLGIDFTSGAPVADFNGMSDMLNYNSANGLTSDAYTFRGAAIHCATGTATIGGHAFTAGDLMFYTDGHYIYDRTHTKMTDDLSAPYYGDANAGTTGELGRTFPAQGALVIPVAGGGITNGVWHQYYVVQNSCDNGPIKMSIVDMTLNSGKGEVLSATMNTTLVASACEYMCLSTTIGTGATAYWHLFYLPSMSSAADDANCHIAAIKFDAAGPVGSTFPAVDVTSGSWDMSNSKARGSGELLINQLNNIITFRYTRQDAGYNDAYTTFVWGLDPATALSATAILGVTLTSGYNGGLNNGVFHWIIGGMYEEQVPVGGLFLGMNAIDLARTLSFSPDGTKLWAGVASYYDPATPFEIVDTLAGWRIMCLDVHSLGQAYYTTQNLMYTWNVVTDPATAFTAPNHGWINGAPFTPDLIKMFPDASTANGWYGSPTSTDRCTTIINDLTFAPDGKLWLNLVEQEQNMPWTQAVGANAQITNSLVRFDVPNFAQGTNDNIDFTVPMGAYDLGARRMGERFPVWLQMPCPCDPVNIVPVTVTSTVPDCPACAPQPPGCYKLTECDCTGGSAGANPCSVNDPNTMPPNMITYGKTWSPTCNSAVPVRWAALTDAVQLLGTANPPVPGTNQTVTFTYSFINDGATFIGMPGGFGPAQAIDTGANANGPGATGINSSCNSYNKSYVITFTQFQAEMAAMFGYIKAMFEGMFNTNCGYGADLTVNFVDLGYETNYTAGDNALANIVNPGNGTSFTDANGVTNIGDFRIGMSDFGGIESCGASGNALQILGLCFNSNLNACDPGLQKAGGHSGQLLFDANEDWRKALDPVVPNSFSLIRVGIHEILHALGFGHDFLTFGAANSCDTKCDCPCFQSDPNCPNIYGGGCPGHIPNMDALMGPFSTNNAFLTDFPGGLMGVNGMYDRRATCGIYGNNSANYACEDGVCLQGAGCVYITHYSDDPVLAGYVGGIITWDDGSPAGERCWEVEAVNPCPAPPPPLINPVAPIGSPSGPTLDCTNCAIPNPCYVLNLCACDTTPGAPATITTDTDMSVYCGALPPQLVVEVDLYPNACYEIDCTPIVCPAAGVVTVVVTNAYLDCATCCLDNTMCYELCPCGPSVASDSCATFTEINVGVSTSVGAALHFISDNANAPLDATDMKTLFYGNNVQPAGSLPCVAPGGGFYRHFPSSFPNAGTFVCYQAGITTPPPGLAWGYHTWTDFLADLVTVGVAGVVNPGTPYFGINMLINAHYGYPTSGPGGVGFGISGNDCECTATQTCTVVTNNLAAQLGQVVTIGPGAPGTLDTDGVDCYEVHLCGVCGTGLCNPLGAVTITGTYPTCPACEGPQGCDCYKLIDCTNASTIINNVCQTAALDTAFVNGDIIQINGNVSQCWIIECDSPLICDPGTCVSVLVTGTFPNCQACLGAQLWECDYPNSCDCVPAAGPGPGVYADCVTMFANEPTCCPPQIGVDCENIMGVCNCVPCFVPPCDYNTGVPATDMLACVSDPTTCCGPTIPESYNCVWDQVLSVYTCIDPGNGTGTFLGPTSLVDCTNCVINNCPDCYIESWNCVTVGGVSTCQDPGDGTGTWNNGNGGLGACVSCNGCPLDPTCVGVIPNYDCDPAFGCIVNWNGTGAYATLAECALDCDEYEPSEGTFQQDCENCLTEIDMKLFFDKVADVCDDCNVPFGLTDQEVTCDTGCFGQSNIYVFLDITSTFGGTYLNRLQEAVNFKTNVIEPAFMQIQTEFPQYNGHLYIIPGGWPYGSLFGPCTDSNGTGMTPPGSPTAPEDWLAWAMYPLSGNKGANGPAPNPYVAGTLPATQRVAMGQTMVDGIGGAPVNCNGVAYDAAVHGPLLEQLMILPGHYTNDGFTQLNPWQDGVGKEGMSDPYHEFEGGDIDSIVVIFQDESRTPGNYGYYEDAAGSNQWGGICNAATWAGLPATNWNDYATDAGNLLAGQWKTDYTNYMSLHEFGWDEFGVANATPWSVTQKTMIYAGSWDTPSVSQSKVEFIYHMFGAIGAQKTDANISYNGHIDCADYVGVPAAFGYQCYVATDPNIPNPYMGFSGGGDPSLVTGYQGGSLSNYGMAFHIPDQPVSQLTSTNLYDLWKEYLSDCE